MTGRLGLPPVGPDRMKSMKKIPNRATATQRMKRGTKRPSGKMLGSVINVGQIKVATKKIGKTRKDGTLPSAKGTLLEVSPSATKTKEDSSPSHSSDLRQK